MPRLMPLLQAVCPSPASGSAKGRLKTTIRVKACSIIKPHKSCIPVWRHTIFPYMLSPPTKTSSPWLLRSMPILSSQTKPTPKPKSAKTTTSGTISTEQALPCNTPTTAVFGQSPPHGCQRPALHRFAAYKQAWLQAYSGQRPSETELPIQTGQNIPLFPAHTGAILPAYQQGGETAALTQWHVFKQNLVHYPITQNFPARKNTSLLNAYLSAGCISPRLLAAEGLANRHFE